MAGIFTEDFRVDLAGKHRGKMFGAGLYFAEMCSKADEYALKNDTNSEGKT